MNSTKKMLAGTLASAALLTSTGAAVVALPVVDTPAHEAYAQEVMSIASDQTANETVKVEGTFSFSQDAMTETKTFSEVFCKAAATLCQAMPEYTATVADGVIHVTGPQGAYDAALHEGEEDSASSHAPMACVCATNVAGGGAAANVFVGGVSVSDLASQVAYLN